MITTIDDGANGFRSFILPMALSLETKASRSLFKAILAVSAFHLGRTEEALEHKTSAIRSLAASVKLGTSPQAVQLAACMMLCVHSVSPSIYIHLWTRCYSYSDQLHAYSYVSYSIPPIRPGAFICKVQDPSAWPWQIAKLLARTRFY